MKTLWCKHSTWFVIVGNEKTCLSKESPEKRGENLKKDILTDFLDDFI